MLLQHYDIRLEYRCVLDNPADYLSRHPAKERIEASQQQKMAEDIGNFIASLSIPNAITIEKVQFETSKDTTLQQVIETVCIGR